MSGVVKPLFRPTTGAAACDKRSSANARRCAIITVSDPLLVATTRRGVREGDDGAAGGGGEGTASMMWYGFFSLGVWRTQSARAGFVSVTLPR